MSNKNVKDPSRKVEIAKRIAASSKNATTFYESIVNLFLRVFRWFSSMIDRLFFSSGANLIIFSLVIAIFAYISVNYDKNSFTSVLTSSKVLNNVSVSAKYNAETFEVSGVPSSCEIILTGEAANVNNAAAKPGYCQINLEGYTEGTHHVSLKAIGYGDNVSATISPSEVQVTLKKKTTMQFDLGYDYINQNQLDSKYILGIPEFSSGTKVNIRASQDTLNSIALVKALIDVGNQNGNFTTEAPLVAYDKNGNVIHAEIVPSTVTVSVGISSPSKRVPITLRTVGEAPTGYSLDTVKMDHGNVELYASQNILDSVSEVVVTLDVSTIASDADIILPIVLPNGVSSSDISMVNIKATLAPSASVIFENVPIEYRNNNNNYRWKDVDTFSVSVKVSGTEANIEKISASDIKVYFDMADLEPGTYEIPLKIETDSSAFTNMGSYLSLSTDPMNINITLYEE